MRYAILAIFPSGARAVVERHRSLCNAQAAVAAMNRSNRREIADGSGFPHGVPVYQIIEIQSSNGKFDKDCKKDLIYHANSGVI